MCGRFAFTSPVEAVADFFKADAGRLDKVVANTNVCPTQDIVTLVCHEEKRILTPMRWGFIPHWYQKPNDGPLLINARAETIHEKPAYRNAFTHRRCVIPVDHYYEWSAKKTGHAIKSQIGLSSGEMLACAAIWQAWRDAHGTRLITCAMVTTAADEQVSPVHHRMPVILDTSEMSTWLGAGQAESLNLRTKVNIQKLDIF